MSEKLETTLPRKNDLVVTFRKPYEFEGKVYTELDLSGLEDMVTGQLFALNKRFAAEKVTAMIPETQTVYCCLAASMVTKLPMEFFDRLPVREGLKVRTVVQNYFFGEDSTESTPPASED